MAEQSDTPTETAEKDSTTLGPLNSLRDHVPDEWWEGLFDETYLLTDGDVLTEDITRREVDRFLDQVELDRSDRILDLCCGQGRHSIELARRGFESIEGLDQSEYLIELARQTARDEGYEISFLTGEARDLPFEDGAFDAVLILGNSFGYSKAAGEDQDILEEVGRVLKPKGTVLLDLADGDYTRENFDPRSWEWASDTHVVCRERELAEDEDRLVARELILHRDHGVKRDQFYSERLYGRRDARRLLEGAGFDSVTSETLIGESTRGQDLGMMAHRFLISARCPPKPRETGPGEEHASWQESPAVNNSSVVDGGNRSLGADLRYVAVVLGDPRLTDETKLGGVFDEDDFEVLSSLREALSSLPNSEFIYFDAHDSLLRDLRTYRDAVDLVFNLCDEGLRNDPHKELHVPALLEALDVPYTGAGPQCLAQCYDKSMIRGVAREMGIPVPDGWFLRPGASPPEEVATSVPVIVKPNAADNSAGMSVDCIAETADELDAAVQSVRQAVGGEQSLIIEEFLPGADLTYGVIGNPDTGLSPLPISEDDYSNLPDHLPPFCGYEAKWIPDSPYWTDVQAVPANLPNETQTQIQSDSHALFERLGCRDYARFDWRLDGDGNPRLLEVNPNPGWSWDSHLVEAAAFTGISYPDVLEGILDAAFERLPADR